MHGIPSYGRTIIYVTYHLLKDYLGFFQSFCTIENFAMNLLACLLLCAYASICLGKFLEIIQKASVSQFSCSVVSDSVQPHGLQQARPPSPTPGVYSNSCSTESVMPSNHLTLCHPLLLPPSIFPTIRVFSNESVLHIRWPKYMHFKFQ